MSSLRTSGRLWQLQYLSSDSWQDQTEMKWTLKYSYHKQRTLPSTSTRGNWEVKPFFVCLFVFPVSFSLLQLSFTLVTDAVDVPKKVSFSCAPSRSHLIFDHLINKCPEARLCFLYSPWGTSPHKLSMITVYIKNFHCDLNI